MRAKVGSDTSTVGRDVAAAVADVVYCLSSEDSHNEKTSETEGAIAATSRERSKPLVTRSQAAPKGMGSKAFDRLKKAREDKTRRKTTRNNEGGLLHSSIIDSDSEGEQPSRVSGGGSRSERVGSAPDESGENISPGDTVYGGSPVRKRYVKTKPHLSVAKKDSSVKAPPLSRGRNKHIPQLVTRDMCKDYISKDREHWLQMSGPELSKICLDNLLEIERQRYLCGNLAGSIDGMFKGCGEVAMNIVRAMTEKMEASGDVIHLRTCLTGLDEELKEVKRRAARQDEEIRELRRTVTRLQRENNVLRAGGGPFSPVRRGPPPADDLHQRGRGPTTAGSGPGGGPRATRDLGAAIGARPPGVGEPGLGGVRLPGSRRAGN